jgi:NTP pyrophosphatase (non-canonical NTP hydrolase)
MTDLQPLTPPRPMMPDLEVLQAWEHYWKFMQRIAHHTAVIKGFWPSYPALPGHRNAGEMIALIHAEASEMLEAMRDNGGSCCIGEGGKGESSKLPGFSTVEEEAADLVIRLMDFAGGHGLRVGEAISAKLAYNLTRPHKHGKAF